MKNRFITPPLVAVGVLLGGGTVAAQTKTEDSPSATEQPSNPTTTQQETQNPISETDAAPAASRPASKPTVTTGADGKKVERFEVVGSRIKRIDVEGPQPVETLDREAITKSGATEVSQLLRDNTITASFGGYRSQVNLGETPASGGNSVNLRGLGEKNTLVLLNGQRLPADGISGGVDVSTIPVAAIERVEILRDGASAIYGSDASGGVVNIVTKKDFDGWNVTARYDAAKVEGGDTVSYSIAHGYVGDKFTSTTVASIRNAEPVYERDIWFTEEKALSSYAFPANVYTASGGVVRSPECPPALIDPSDGRCKYDYTRTTQVYPKTNQLSVLNTSSYAIDNDLTVFGRVLASQNIDKHNMAPNAAEFAVGPTTAAAIANPAIPNYVAGEDASFLVRTVGLGNRDTTSTVKSYDVLLGLKGELNNGYTWDVSGSTGRQRIELVNDGGYARISSVVALIDSGAYNPLSASNPGAIAAASYSPWTTVQTHLTKMDANLTGELFSLSGGPAQFNAGVSVAHEDYENDADEPSTKIDPVLQQSDVLGNSATSGNGKRDSKAVYGELAMPLFTGFELDLAARFDHYSDFGSALNPKVSFSYKPIDAILVRGSAGTGFKAPQLRRMYMSRSESHPYYQDLVDCRRRGIADAACKEAQVQTFESGNKDLKEETSKSYNLGVLAEPTDYFNIGVEYWMTEIKDAVPAQYDYTQISEAEAKGVNLAANGIIINRRTSGEIDFIEAPLQNLARQEIKGWDTTAGLHFKPAGQRLNLDSAYGVIQSYRAEDIPGLGLTSRLEENATPKWRVITNAAWGTGSHDVSVRNVQISKHRKNSNQNEYVGSYSTYDAQYQWRAPWNGVFIVGMQNAFDKKPPLDDTQEGVSQVANNLYSLLGRTVYVSISQDF